MNKQTPTRANVVVLKQILKLIPRGMINRHAIATGVEAKARTFSVLSERQGRQDLPATCGQSMGHG